LSAIVHRIQEIAGASKLASGDFSPKGDLIQSSGCAGVRRQACFHSIQGGLSTISIRKLSVETHAI
jgi:hypothetical protein